MSKATLTITKDGEYSTIIATSREVWEERGWTVVVGAEAADFTMGDTGWRGIGALISGAGLNPPDIQIRRIGNTVYFAVDPGYNTEVAPELGSGTSVIPSGFRTVPTTAGGNDVRVFLLGSDDISVVAAALTVARDGQLSVSLADENGVNRTGYAAGVAEWETNDPWPPVLPGTQITAPRTPKNASVITYKPPTLRVADTGWRDVSTAIEGDHTGGSDHQLQVRRVGDEVTVRYYAEDTAHYNDVQLGSMDGFGYQGFPQVIPTFGEDGYYDDEVILTNDDGGFITAGRSGWKRAEFTYRTESPFPTTLPGTKLSEGSTSAGVVLGGNGGFNLEDTGWRMINFYDDIDDNADRGGLSRLCLRRVGNVVYIQQNVGGVGYVGDNVLQLTAPAGRWPAGFRPSLGSSCILVGGSSDPDLDALGYFILFPDGGFTTSVPRLSTTLDDTNLNLAPFLTEDDWPETLPGEPYPS